MDSFSLPQQPLIVIEPKRSWLALDLRELREYRELLFFLTWRDVKVRYKQASIGVLWAILQPMFLTLICVLFYGRLAAIGTGRTPYALFAFSGLTLWTFFSTAITLSSNSLINNVSLVTKVYFPRILVPIAAVTAGLVDLVLCSVLLLVMVVWHGVPLRSSLWMVPVIVALTAALASAVGMWLAAMNVKYRDIRFLVPFALQVWLFASSVIIPSAAVPARWRWLLDFNRVSALVEAHRAAWLGLPFDWRAIAIAAAATLLLFIASVFAFKRMERKFADVI